MKTCSMVIYLFLVISGSLVLAEHKAPSKNLFRFLTLVSGYFDNQVQLSTDNCTGASEYHEPATVLCKPVEIDSLHDKEGATDSNGAHFQELTLYLEGTIMGKVMFRNLWVVSEDCCGVIHVKLFKILDSDSYGPGELKQLDFNHFRFQPQTNDSDCEILFFSVDDNVFVGTKPGCFGAVSEPLPLYGNTLTCYSVSFHVCTVKISDKNPILPYIYFKKYSYPLTSAMTKGATFETDCFYHHD